MVDTRSKRMLRDTSEGRLFPIRSGGFWVGKAVSTMHTFRVGVSHGDWGILTERKIT